MNDPRVSIIIPAYNSEKYICDTIDSVFAQTYKNFELIVIDDGSTDNMRETMREYLDKIKYIFQKNKGTNAARNRGIKESRGEYIAFLDNDDLWFPEKLKWQTEIMDNFPETGMIFTDGQWFSDEKIVRLSSRPTENLGDPCSLKHKIATTDFDDGTVFKGNFYKDFLIGNLVLNSSAFVRLKCLNDVGLLDEELKINGDYDLWLRLSEKYPIIYFNKITTKWRVREDSLSGGYDIRAFNYRRWNGLLFEKHLRRCSKGDKAFVRRRAWECYKISSWGYLRYGYFMEACRLSLKGIIFNPWDIKLYLYILKSVFLFLKKRITTFVNYVKN